jgi:hypothetical protein
MRIRLFSAAVVAVGLTVTSVAEASLQLTATFRENHSAVANPDVDPASGNNVDTGTDLWSLAMSGSSPWQAGVQITSVIISLDTGVWFDDDNTGPGGSTGNWNAGFPFVNLGGTASLADAVVDAAKKNLTLTFSSFDYDDNFLFSIDVDNSNAVVRGLYTGSDGHDMRGATVTVDYFNGSSNTSSQFAYTTGNATTATGVGAIQAVPEPMTFAVWSGLALAGLAIGWQRKRAQA